MIFQILDNRILTVTLCNLLLQFFCKDIGENYIIHILLPLADNFDSQNICTCNARTANVDAVPVIKSFKINEDFRRFNNRRLSKI